MADAMDTPSLVGMVSATGKAARDAGDSRYKTVKSAASGNASHNAAQTRRGGFDGFLNTFLGKDKAGAGASSRPGKTAAPAGAAQPRTPGKTRGKAKAATLAEHLNAAEKPARNSGSKKTDSPGRAAGRMAAEDRQALRESMDKTVAGDEGGGDAVQEQYPPEVVAAADEAAALIWNLLYGQTEGAEAALADFMGEGGAPAAMPPAGDMTGAEAPGGDALKAIASRIGATAAAADGGALAGMGAGAEGAVDLSALQDAIDTANASAEMNSAAVLSALGGLLDGMPRPAWEEALLRTADAMGVPAAGEGDVFDRIAAALGAEVVDVGGGEAGLLSFLGGAAVHTGAAVAADAAVDVAVPAEAIVPVAAAGEAEVTVPAEGAVPVDMVADAEAEVEAGAEVPAEAVPPAREGERVAAAVAADAAAESAMAVPDAEPAPAGEAVAIDLPAETVAPAAPAEAEPEAAPAPEQHKAPAAAESSGAFPADDGGAGEENGALLELFSKFIQENPAAGMSADADAAPEIVATQVVAHFADWLQANGNAKEAKQIAADANAFVLALAKSAAEGLAVSVETGEKISWTRANLEVFLQNAAGKAEIAAALNERETAATPGAATLHIEPGAPNNAVGPHSQSVLQTPAAAQHGTANPSAMSSMLDQMENIERLAEAMKMSARNSGVKELTMQLSPPELGKIMLRVESVNGAVNAYLRVEKPEAAAQLGSALDQLRETLKGQGIELGELSLRQQGSNEALGDFSGQRQSGREANESRERGRRRHGASRTNDEDADAPAAVSSSRAGPGALNLFA